MNQQCKVCGEPAAGFHFGAFTCEGCKSFFGRSYNNLSSISECKNGGECVINKKNRTACKACRLRKCLLVGMSKSGSRYGRRSNWFKIHCLLQEQQQQQQQHQQQHQQQQLQSQRSPSISGGHMGHRKEEMLMLGIDDYKNSTSPSISSPESHNSDSSVDVSERRAAMNHHPGFRPLHPHHAAELSALSKEMLGLPLGFHLPGMPLIPSGFLPPHGIPIFPPYHLYGTPQGTPHPLLPGHCGAGGLIHHPSMVGIHGTGGNNNDNFNTVNNNINTNNNDRHTQNQNSVSPNIGNVTSVTNPAIEAYTKRFYLEAVLKSQQTPTSRSPVSSKTNSDNEEDINYSPRFSPELKSESGTPPPPQDNPMDLSMKNLSTLDVERENIMTFTPESSRLSDPEDIDMNDVISDDDDESPPAKKRPAPIDLTCSTTRV